MERPHDINALVNNAGDAFCCFERIMRSGERYVWEVNPGPMLERALNTVDSILANAPWEAFIDDVLDLRYLLSSALITTTRIRAEYDPRPAQLAQVK